jgi:multiple sugar transport system permease protein
MTLSRRYAFRLLGLVALLAFTAFFFVPIIWLLRAPSENDGTFGSLSAFVRTFNTMITWQGGSLLIWMKNSAIYSFGGVAIALALSIPAGYGLALTQFIGRRALLAVTLVVMIMPASALVLPLFLEAYHVGLLNTRWSIILPFGLFPFGTYLTYIFFSSTIPKELLAAARIDGAGEWGVFRHIALPLARPIIALVGFFALVTDWNNFLLPDVMTANDTTGARYPLQLGLQQMVNVGVGGTPWNSAMATIIAVAPVLVVFTFAQRMLVRGMFSGASKE